MLSPGQTGVGDRGYQKHVLFDLLQVEGKSFVIRIKAGTNKTPIKKHEVNPDCIVFFMMPKFCSVLWKTIIGRA